MPTTVEAASAATGFLKQPKRRLIDGGWVDARHGRTLEVYDPAFGEVIDHVPAGDAEDVTLAVAAARRATWPEVIQEYTETKSVCIGL